MRDPERVIVMVFAAVVGATIGSLLTDAFFAEAFGAGWVVPEIVSFVVAGIAVLLSLKVKDSLVRNDDTSTSAPYPTN